MVRWWLMIFSITGKYIPKTSIVVKYKLVDIYYQDKDRGKKSIEPSSLPQCTFEAAHTSGI
jgi:hypothetical protein